MSVQDAQDEKTDIQKRTFTRWINVYLNRRDPPAEVYDLFQDIQDGRVLMMLLEELTGCRLLYRFRSSSHRIFRLNNISKALAFLDDRHVKLLGIDASAVADGVASVVLNLIWNIILHFQVKEMTGGLHRRLSSSLSSLSVDNELTDDSAPNPGRNTTKSPKYSGKTIKNLLYWVQRSTVKFGVEVRDFGRSWRNGLAFLALIKSINPDLVDLRYSLTKNPVENLEQAFMLAQDQLDIPPLLDPQDVIRSCPDEKSIITYVSMFLRHCPDLVEDLSTAVNSPHISKFRSLETLENREETQPVFRSLETSDELLLWKCWARKQSNSSSQSKRKTSNTVQPPSPLDAFVANPDICSWLIKSADHGYSKTKNNEIQFSLSSEEGIYSVTPLDSDEEDAYSYILDLNEDQSQARRQVPRVEEESEGISLNSEMCGLSGGAESGVYVHNKGLNGYGKEMYENDRGSEDSWSKRSYGESVKSDLFSEFQPQRSQDLAGDSQEQIRTEAQDPDLLQTLDLLEKTQVMLQAMGNRNNTNKSNNRLNVFMREKTNEGNWFRNPGKSTNSSMKSLSEDSNRGSYNNEFTKLRQAQKVVGEAGLSTEAKVGSGSVSGTRSQRNGNEKPLYSGKTREEASQGKYNVESAKKNGVLAQSVAPSRGYTWTEIRVMLSLWILLYCYFIVLHIFSD